MSLKILEYFNYLEQKSPLHFVDPRGKTLFIIAITCLTIFLDNIIPMCIILLIMLPLIFLGHFTKRWLKSLLFLTPVILIVVILNALLLKVDYPTTKAIILGLRLIILSGFFGLFFQTVSPDDISQALIKFKFPYPFAWAISTAYRFIPTLAKETNIIVDAQKSRGLQIDRGNLFKRVKNMIPLLIPIFATAMRRSWQLAEAIESRGWNAIKNRTYLYTLRLKWWDIIVILLSLGIFALFLYLVITNAPLPFWLAYNIPERFELKRLFLIAWTWIKNLFT
ncbi:MAG: energy-coupling factor transporter transmembrane component T family protein [Candidatus Heimdallarchaeota archaeon]